MPFWITAMSQEVPTAWTILMLALVISSGLMAGNIRFRGIGLGSAGVLFAGILVGCLSHPLQASVLDFLKEFGLVLFVFTIGLQLGPGFAASLRAEGLRLNALSSSVVLLGTLVAVAAILSMPLHPAGILGALSGAVTNTPSLGATQQALKGLPAAAGLTADIPAMAYAVAYPGGIAGIIISLLLLRWWFRIDAKGEAASLAAEMGKVHEPFERRSLRVDNPSLDGMEAHLIPGQRELGVTISRHRAKEVDEVQPIQASTRVHLGDIILVVGPRHALDRFQPVVGQAVGEDLIDAPGLATFTRMVVTDSDATGQNLGALRLAERFGVTVTRVQRSGIEMAPQSGLRLHFGDLLFVVGESKALEQAAAAVGNQPQELNSTHFTSIFTGIGLGVLLGMLPIALPGLPEPVRLGLAGGPLLIAILLGRIGNFRRFIWHMPEIANRSIRELGISLFLASVGLKSGPAFFATVMTGDGACWVAIGLCITVIPLITIGWFARRVLRMNFIRISGLLAGSMTDPPALAFASTLAGSDGPASAYATVYPLSMLLRIVIAQILAVLLCR